MSIRMLRYGFITLLMAVLFCQSKTFVSAGETEIVAFQFQTGLVEEGNLPDDQGTVLTRQLIYKFIGLVLGTAVIFFVAYFVVYRKVLENRRAWPVSLFGSCTTAALAATTVLIWVVLREELRIAPYSTFFQQYGLTCVVVGTGTLLSVISWFVWRTKPVA